MATAITYWGPFSAVTAPDGTLFKRGTSEDVEDALAASLLLQDFRLTQASTPAPATAPAANPTSLSGDGEAPAIQAPAQAVSVAPEAAPAVVLTPTTGVS